MRRSLQEVLVGIPHRLLLHRRPRCLSRVGPILPAARVTLPPDLWPSIFVGVPNIAQDKIDAAKLDIQGVNILETEPDSFLMEVNSTITTDGSIHADVDGFVGQMYLEDLEGHKPFASLEFPPTTAAKNQEVNVSQQVNIADMDAFRTFNIWFVNNETLKITIDGKTKVKPSGLDRKYDVDFKKTLEVKGLNLFRGTEVIEETARLELEDDDEGKNFYGEADIPNPSHFTLDIVSFPTTLLLVTGLTGAGKRQLHQLRRRPGGRHPLHRQSLPGARQQPCQHQRPHGADPHHHSAPLR